MRKVPFNSGGTDTAKALNEIYNTDLRTSAQQLGDGYIKIGFSESISLFMAFSNHFEIRIIRT